MKNTPKNDPKQPKCLYLTDLQSDAMLKTHCYKNNCKFVPFLAMSWYIFVQKQNDMFSWKFIRTISKIIMAATILGTAYAIATSDYKWLIVTLPFLLFAGFLLVFDRWQRRFLNQ